MPETRPHQKNQTVAVWRQAVLSLNVSEQRRKFITIQNANDVNALQYKEMRVI